MTNRIGDRPRFPLSNQRFDKGDAENIARYYEEIISRFTGSIYGQAWGCVSNPQFEVVTGSIAGPYIRPKRCVLLHSVPADTAAGGTNPLNTTSEDKGPWDATIVQFDPDRPGQPAQGMATSTYLPTGRPPLRPWVLFRRLETATNTGNKAWWNTSTNTEDIGATPLQDSEYVEFKLSTTYSSNDRIAGWYRCAYIDSWGSPASAATPVIVPIHWMDSQYYADSTPPVAGTAIASALALSGYPGAIGTFGFNPATEMPELAKLLHWTVGKLGQHFSTVNTVQVTEPFAATYNVKPGAFVANYTGDGGWLSTPPRGLLELHTDLAAAEQDITDLQAVDLSIIQSVGTLLSRIVKTPRLLTTLYFTPVQGSSSDWTDYTFDLRYDSATQDPVSFAPTIADYDSATGQLRYKLVPQSSGKKIKFHLRNNSAEATKYTITSVHIVPYDDPSEELEGRPALLVHQRYINVPPPLGSALETSVEFAVSLSPSTIGELTGSDEVIRPFAINIYGRNV